MASCAVKCHDCGWEETYRDNERVGRSAEESAKAAKGGHIGGGRKHGNRQVDCRDVEVVC